tara:strand:+ start:78 stop:899 length:822 start_codon:yes stop_codon:yes gene_type:complete
MIKDHKVFDCVIFFNEVDLLNIRFNILDKFVDYFVICESNCDHRGRDKKLNFDIKNFKKFEKKIIYIVLEKFPDSLDAWQRQDYQRDFLMNGINNAKLNDIILFSDVDEIPNLEINMDRIINNLDKVGIFNQKVFYFKLNLRVVDYEVWEGTKVLLKKNLRSFSWLRSKVKLKNLKYNFWRIDKFKKIYEIPNGGWHFSFLGSPESISSKIKSYTHSEYDTKEFTDLKKINDRILNLQDPYDRNKELQKIPIDNTFPKYIQDNQDKLKNIILF